MEKNQIQTTMEIPETPESFKRQKKVYVSRQECTRYNAETGEYNDKPVDPEYFKKYYHAHSEKVTCQFCGKLTGQFKMFRHVKSQKCLKAQQLNKMIPLDDKFLETLDF